MSDTTTWAVDVIRDGEQLFDSGPVIPTEEVAIVGYETVVEKYQRQGLPAELTVRLIRGEDVLAETTMRDGEILATVSRL